ncbi:MAG: DUF1919 domain-containing protein [Bacteroidota bacterium]|nr:DUF1919 domain-containing protein [Bacteroidota bacterium]
MINKLKAYWRKLIAFKNLFKIKFLKAKETRYKAKIRKQLNNHDFTIISNNCWGGRIYEDLGLPYTTPTVGLFFFTPCYIQFIQNLKRNLESEVKFIEYSKYPLGNDLRKSNPYPIGLLNNEIEIHFMHYETKEKALEKWVRRKERINYKNLFFSLTDNDLCTLKEIEVFDKLPFKKVFFSAKDITGVNSLVWLKQFESQGKVGDLYSCPWLYRKYFNVVKWLNG